MDVQQTPINYWVAELWDGQTLVGRWTTERPGKTGPADLADRLDQLREDGWRVYEVSVSGDPWPQWRREAWAGLAFYVALLLLLAHAVWTLTQAIRILISG